MDHMLVTDYMLAHHGSYDFHVLHMFISGYKLVVFIMRKKWLL